jgi:hypothetical protein
MLYAALKIIPKDIRNPVKKLIENVPSKHKNSATKLNVPGVAILARDAMKKKKQNRGIVKLRPL